MEFESTSNIEKVWLLQIWRFVSIIILIWFAVQIFESFKEPDWFFATKSLVPHTLVLITIVIDALVIQRFKKQLNPVLSGKTYYQIENDLQTGIMKIYSVIFAINWLFFHFFFPYVRNAYFPVDFELLYAIITFCAWIYLEYDNNTIFWRNYLQPFLMFLEKPQLHTIKLRLFYRSINGTLLMFLRLLAVSLGFVYPLILLISGFTYGYNPGMLAFSFLIWSLIVFSEAFIFLRYDPNVEDDPHIPLDRMLNIWANRISALLFFFLSFYVFTVPDFLDIMIVLVITLFEVKVRTLLAETFLYSLITALKTLYGSIRNKLGEFEIDFSVGPQPPPYGNVRQKSSHFTKKSSLPKTDIISSHDIESEVESEKFSRPGTPQLPSQLTAQKTYLQSPKNLRLSKLSLFLKILEPLIIASLIVFLTATFILEITDLLSILPLLYSGRAITPYYWLRPSFDDDFAMFLDQNIVNNLLFLGIVGLYGYVLSITISDDTRLPFIHRLTLLFVALYLASQLIIYLLLFYYGQFASVIHFSLFFLNLAIFMHIVFSRKDNAQKSSDSVTTRTLDAPIF